MCIKSVQSRVALALAEYLDIGVMVIAYRNMYLHPFAVVLGFGPDTRRMLEMSESLSATLAFHTFRYLIEK